MVGVLLRRRPGRASPGKYPPPPRPPAGKRRNVRLDRGPEGTRGRHCLRHHHRGTRQGGRCAAVPGGGHRGAGRARAASRRSGACSWTARYEPGLPPAEPHPLSVRTGDPRVDLQAALAMLGPEWGLQAADRHRRRDRSRRPGAGIRDGAVLRGPVGSRRRPPAGPPARGGQGHVDPRALPHPLARRGRPRPREGDRRLLDLGRRARHERLHLHGARDRLHRRRRGRRPLRRRGCALRVRCTAAPPRACWPCSTGWRRRATPSST